MFVKPRKVLCQFGVFIFATPRFSPVASRRPRLALAIENQDRESVSSQNSILPFSGHEPDVWCSAISRDLLYYREA